MPMKRTVWDKGDHATNEPARTVEMWEIDAREAVQNGKGRYALTKPPGFGAPPPAGKAKPAKPPEPAAVSDEAVVKE